MFVDVRPRRATQTFTFVRTLSARDRAVVVVLTIGWSFSLFALWVWWFSPSHNAGWAGLSINSVLLLCMTAPTGYYFLSIARLRNIDPALPVPRVRVAFVVTRAPSEQWSVARRTLEAMLVQRYPLRYDVWLCDEDPDDTIVEWCRTRGVRVSCRRGIADYHRVTWPRRTKCKEGNLAFFYDKWGYQSYDVVAQLDCDHVPEPTYLAAMVRPFIDPAVGYVAAPSICDANADGSWSARGRLHREAAWHGAIQLGHNGGLAPVCIGSHYAVRTRALQEIGGLGPELAEDFSTSFLLSSAGWEGAFAIEAEAHGDGPLTFADMLTQEFQWSRSLTVLFFELLPRHLKRMRPGLRLRFTYAVVYYPLLAVTMTLGLALPPIAVGSGVPWVNVNYVSFVAHIASIGLWPLLLTILLRRRGVLRPRYAPLLSWEGALFALTRWPYVAMGVFAATVRNKPITFKVTPKARTGLEPLPVRLTVPYLFLSMVLSVTALFGETYGTRAPGYIFLCIVGALFYSVVSVAVPYLHITEAARAAKAGLSRTLRTAWVPLLLGAFTIVPVALASGTYFRYAMGALGW
jgi:cellulose synthase/poly-beta-1,6-N-acetylglucosamine synthase-like glycosyltransferase